MRRRGFPLMGGFGMGMGGMGMGMGSGSLLGDLAAGGIGYLLGSRSAQQQSQQYQTPQYQPPPQQYQTPQYQAPQYQAPPAAPYQQAPTDQATNEKFAQLKLLGHLRDSNLLTNDEFEEEKQKILHG